MRVYVSEINRTPESRAERKYALCFIIGLIIVVIIMCIFI
jgi:hypothetical protein